MSTETNSIKDHMARVRLKLVQQKIANEKDRLMNRPGTGESSTDDLENQARLQQAMLKRQELLDKIRREQLLNDDTKRPRSYNERRRYTPSPLPMPPSRHSLPDFARYKYYNQDQPDTNRSIRNGQYDMNVPQMKHVIEHKISSPPPQRLPPITHRQPLPPPQPGVIIHPPPHPQIMQAPAPQIIQSPPQHVIQQIPQPVIQNLTGQPQETKSMFNKAEFGDMMMMQNAQLHQLVMQKWMINGIGGAGMENNSSSRRRSNHSSCSQRHGCHGNYDHHGNCGPMMPPPPMPPPPCNPAVARPIASVPGGAVHHHHYTSPPPPPSQPAVHHYTTMPAMEMRGGYPLRGYASGYTGPGTAFSPYDDGNNYFYYH